MLNYITISCDGVRLKLFACAAASALTLFVMTDSKAAEKGPDDPWAQVPIILKRIVPPGFPQREFVITNFGATAGGSNLCTTAFANAIAACHQAGGGRVVVPSGKFLTGPIHLQSNIELHLAKNSEIIFSDRYEDYLPPVLVRVGGIEIYNYSPLIYARDCENIAVTGAGRLNGNAKKWWGWKSKESGAFFEMAARGVPVEQRVFGTTNAAIRPSFLSFVGCTNVLLEDFTIGGGPNWTIHPVYCQNLTIRRVNVDTDGPNNDGIDPDSCRDLLIEDCTFSTGDDCVVLKSGYNEDGWRVGRPTENVIMRHCSSKRGHGGLVIGSEMSGDVRNVFMHDCDFEGTDRAIRIKSKRGRGGVVENIFARDVKARNMQREVVILNMDYTSDKNKAANEKPPVFRNMCFQNINCDGAPTAILITGLEDAPIQDIRFEDMTVTSTRGVVCSDVKNLVFKNVSVSPAKSPVFELKNAVNVTIQNAKAPKGTDVFLKVEGKSSTAIQIQDSNLTEVKIRFVTGTDVPADAVTVK